MAGDGGLQVVTAGHQQPADPCWLLEMASSGLAITRVARGKSALFLLLWVAHKNERWALHRAAAGHRKALTGGGGERRWKQRAKNNRVAAAAAGNKQKIRL